MSELEKTDKASLARAKGRGRGRPRSNKSGDGRGGEVMRGRGGHRSQRGRGKNRRHGDHASAQSRKNPSRTSQRGGNASDSSSDSSRQLQPCPVCGANIELAAMNTHLDSCLSINSSSPPGGKRRSKKGIDISHLIDFAPRERPVPSERSRPVRRYDHKRIQRSHVYNRETFVQANCQFYVDVDGDYGLSIADPDKLVDWDSVRRVMTFVSEIPRCPICLGLPVAARITRCGHIYCYHCILHHLSEKDSQQSWHACPLCDDFVYDRDLRSVSWTLAPRPEVGNCVRLRLLKRERGSTVALPANEWDITPSEVRSAPTAMLTRPGLTKDYFKIVPITLVELHDMYARERDELMRERGDAVALGYVPDAFIDKAIASIDQLLRRCKGTRHEKAQAPGPESNVPHMDSASIKQWDGPQHAHSQQTVATSALRSDHAYPHLIASSSFDSVLPRTNFLESDGERIHENYAEASSGDVGTFTPYTSSAPVKIPSHNGLHRDAHTGLQSHSWDSESWDTSAAMPGSIPSPSEYAAGWRMPSTDFEPNFTGGDHAVNPRTAATSSLQGASESLPLDAVSRRKLVVEKRPHKDKNVHTYFQAASGQPVFLCSLNMRCLTHEYGDGNYPASIECPIIEVTHEVMTQELRKRYRYLDHLPVSTEFAICELDLRSLLSPATLEQFESEFEARRKSRRKRAVAEKRLAKQRAKQIRNQEERQQRDWEKEARQRMNIVDDQIEPALWSEAPTPAALVTGNTDNISLPVSASPSTTSATQLSFSRAVGGVMSDEVQNPPLSRSIDKEAFDREHPTLSATAQSQCRNDRTPPTATVWGTSKGWDHSDSAQKEEQQRDGETSASNYSHGSSSKEFSAAESHTVGLGKKKKKGVLVFSTSLRQLD